MNKKPIIIITSILLLAACAFLFIRSRYLAKPDKKEVIVFLEKFSLDLKKGNNDTLLNYFDGKQDSKQLGKLLGLLSNKTSLNGRDSALFYVSLLNDNSSIKIINSELTTITIPVAFNEHGNNTKQSTLVLLIRKISVGKFKIMQIDARQFINDFIAYENNIRSREENHEITYSPITLQSFKTAESLKTRYDSVIWFTHVDNRTFFYVVKGNWDMEKDLDPRYRNKDSLIAPYKMGLLNPELKEIIPPDYDLIYNISGTFPGLVEVEKDGKRGFYDLNGKIVVPVNYDQIFPINDDADIAILRRGDDYFYLGKDFNVSNKVDINIGDYLSKIKNLNNPSNLYKEALTVVTEYNSKENPGAIYIAPSYLVDLNMIEKTTDFKNPLRKGNYEFIHENYDIATPDKGDGKQDNWIMASFYSIRDHFLGGRGDFYDKRNMLLVDKKRNRILSQDIATDFSPDGQETLGGACDVSSIKLINDSLIEVKSGAVLYAELYDSTKIIVGGPYYHYLIIKDNKLIELPSSRSFNFTKYVKMDDSYINGCYNMLTGTGFFDKRKKSTIDQLTPEILSYMKNEIYADYRYNFKDKRWQRVFAEMNSYNSKGTDKELPNNTNVDDSLTAIDKYNINWINNKLKQSKPTQTLAATK
jgi:hypothetical protein